MKAFPRGHAGDSPRRGVFEPYKRIAAAEKYEVLVDLVGPRGGGYDNRWATVRSPRGHRLASHGAVTLRSCMGVPPGCAGTRGVVRRSGFGRGATPRGGGGRP